MGGIYTNKIYREKKDKNFTKIPNTILRDKNISLKAKGFLCLMISLPKIWKHNIKGFSAICKDGTDSIKTVIKELEEFGYLERERVRNSKGCLIDTKYTLLLGREFGSFSTDSGKEEDFTLTANFHLRDKELSLKAKGLFTLILSLPDEWEFSVKGLRSFCKEGADCINSAFKELKEKKYIVRGRKRTADGKFLGSEYTVYEDPSKADDQDKEQRDLPVSDNPILEKPVLDNPVLEKPILGNPVLDNPVLGNPILDNPILENPSQSNTNILNTNISNTKELNTKESNTVPINLSKDNDVNELNGADDLYDTVNKIKKNISYNTLCICYKDNINVIDSIVDIMSNTIVFNKDPIKINNNKIPAETVKERFLSLNYDNIIYTASILINNSSEIKNIRNYTISVLYNTKNHLCTAKPKDANQNNIFPQTYNSNYNSPDYSYGKKYYSMPVKKNSFNGYEQREYDDAEFDEIVSRKLAQSCR